MTTTLQPPAQTIPVRRFKFQAIPLTWVSLTLIGILALALFLRVINFASMGDGNTYYTAAVKSMLQSPYNFFYAVAEPGGSVTVDKPPMGLWLQAISAAIFGVNTFAVALPQIVAGVLSVLVLFHLVRRSYGNWPGLIAAFVLAVSPVSVAVDRTNNIDSTLIFTLLLATWAFIKATETGKLRHLLTGAILIGIGFNIKMLQAWLVLPALYGMYFFGVSATWRRKITHLAAATVVLLAVSLSWVMVVDLTPKDQRPFIGSSSTNSALELALGYNGLSRLLGMQRGDDGANRNVTPSANPPAGFQPPADDGTLRQPPAGMQMGGGPGGVSENGQTGVFRLFSAPLSNEIGWLLPAGLLFIAALLFSERLRFPLGKNHRFVMLWGGWLVTGVVFFSVSGFFHAYYLATIAPPLAALTGIGIAHFWKASRHWTIFALVAIALATAGYQLWNANAYGVNASLQTVLMIGAGVVGIAGSVIFLRRANWRKVAFAGLTAAMLVMPTTWAFMTATDNNQSASLPHAYAGNNSSNSFGSGIPGRDGGQQSVFSTETINYLLANTANTKYLVAVSSSMMGSSLILETGRPVLLMGGFSGSDQIHTADDIAAMVKNSELRFIMLGGMGGPGSAGSQSEIDAWVTSNCSIARTGVSSFMNSSSLYDCRVS